MRRRMWAAVKCVKQWSVTEYRKWRWDLAKAPGASCQSDLAMAPVTEAGEARYTPTSGFGCFNLCIDSFGPITIDLVLITRSGT
jgi:hypothetical protein